MGNIATLIGNEYHRGGNKLPKEWIKIAFPLKYIFSCFPISESLRSLPVNVACAFMIPTVETGFGPRSLPQHMRSSDEETLPRLT